MGEGDRRDFISLWLGAMTLQAGMNQTATQQQAIEILQAAYAAFNRGDITATLQGLDENILWIEPAGFPGGGTYHGHAGVRAYLTQSRANWAEGSSQPERFIPAGDKIVVFVHARVRPKNSQEWSEVRLADVFTFHNGRAVQMKAFADRGQALEFAGLPKPPAIARIWRGRVKRERADEYQGYNYEFGIKPLIEKAMAVQALREDRETESEFITISYWESIEGMSRFTGGDPTHIHHLERDGEFLIELPKTVQILRICESHGLFT
jgi:ketosteroid isomerase-like protein